MALSEAELDELLALAHRAADAARRETLPRFRAVDVEWKADGSPVTEADRSAERAIRAVLRETGFGMLGEEYGDEAGGAPDDGGGDGGEDGPRWIIDPIDGTIAYSRGLPLYSTLIGLVEGERSVLGLIDLPPLDERIDGRRGGGARRGGQSLRVSGRDDLERAIVAHGDVFCFDRTGEREVFLELARRLPFLRGYTDAFGHAQVIAGALDAMIDLDLNPWDAAPTQVLVEEAGGRCVTRTQENGKLSLCFGSPALVEQLLGFFDRFE